MKPNERLTFANDAMKFYFQSIVIPRKELEECLDRTVITDGICPQNVEAAVWQLLACVRGENVLEVRYPADWWQAVKARFLPKFILKRFPVVERVWQIDRHYPPKYPQGIIRVYNEHSRGFTP